MSDDLSQIWIDRDVSWLEFNRRVLQEAFDERNPLLERLKFLAIFSSNLDEFFQKRIAILRPPPEDDSLAARERREEFARTRELIVAMLAQQAALLRGGTAAAARRARDPPGGLGGPQRRAAGGGSVAFQREVLPVLTPLSLDAAHPFPYVSNLSTSWAFQLEDPVSGESVLVRVKVPSELPQWMRVRAGMSAGARVFVGLDQVIPANAVALFPGMGIVSASLFRVCRDAEVEVDEAEAASKRPMVEEELRQRRFEPVVRLEVQPDAEPTMVAELEDTVRADAGRRVRDAGAARLHDAVRDRRPGGRTAARSALDAAAADRSRTGRRETSSPRSAAGTSCCTTRTTASMPASSGSSVRPRTIR